MKFPTEWQTLLHKEYQYTSKTRMLEVLMTPQLASLMLECEGVNRKTRDVYAKRYAKDMLDENWTTDLTMVGIDTENKLRNGKHRLSAIVKTGRAQTLVIRFGLTKRDVLNIDTGAVRSLRDGAAIAELEGDYGAAIAACAKCMERGKIGSMRLSNAVAVATVDRFREGCAYAIRAVPHKKGICVSPVTTAVARAWYWEKKNESKLTRFCKILGDGVTEGSEESAAIILRDYLLANRDSSSSARWGVTFRLSMLCIRNYMMGVPMKKVVHVQDDRYLLHPSLFDDEDEEV